MASNVRYVVKNAGASIKNRSLYVTMYQFLRSRSNGGLMDLGYNGTRSTTAWMTHMYYQLGSRDGMNIEGRRLRIESQITQRCRRELVTEHDRYMDDEEAEVEHIKLAAP